MNMMMHGNIIKVHIILFVKLYIACLECGIGHCGDTGADIIIKPISYILVESNLAEVCVTRKYGTFL